MKIIDIKSNEILYDSKGKGKFRITFDFWEALKSKKIQYMSGGMKDGARYSEILILDLEARDFDKIFEKIANSGIGKEVMEGRMSIDTRL